MRRRQIKTAFTATVQSSLVWATAKWGKLWALPKLPSRDSPISDQDAASIEGGIRALVRRNRLAVAAELIDHPCDNALMAGAASIADIDKLMAELQTARDFLQSEAERVRRMNARYAHLAQTASASVKVIAESLGRWRDTESGSLPHAAMPRAEAPSLSPPHDPDSETEFERSVAPRPQQLCGASPLNCFADVSHRRCPFRLMFIVTTGLDPVRSDVRESNRAASLSNPRSAWIAGSVRQ